jgi:hypothetical protein
MRGCDHVFVGGVLGGVLVRGRLGGVLGVV